MKKAYDTLKKRLDELYTLDKRGNVCYYLKNGEIVAAIENETISMYFSAPPDFIYSHNSIAIVTVVKDFRLFNRNNIRQLDVMIIQGMWGTITHMKKEGDTYLARVYNNNPLSIGSIGKLFYEDDCFRLEFFDFPYVIVYKGLEWKTPGNLNYICFANKKLGLKHLETDSIYKMICDKYLDFGKEGTNNVYLDGVRDKIAKLKYSNYHTLGEADMFRVNQETGALEIISGEEEKEEVSAVELL